MKEIRIRIQKKRKEGKKYWNLEKFCEKVDQI